MNDKSAMILSKHVEEEFLPYVQMPSRYIGGEINQVNKDPAGCDVRAALCFPDVYEVGMSNSGLSVIYDILNQMDGVCAERVFSPWADAEAVLREKRIPLFSLESHYPLGSFDIIGFSLTNELCYTNMLNALDLAGLAVRSKDRSQADALVIAGGGMANCCEPAAPFVDLFVIGEGEGAVVELVKLYRSFKRAGRSKTEFLTQAAGQFPWAYVPSLYEFEYDGQSIKTVKTSAGMKVERSNAVVEDFEKASWPVRPVVPFTQAVHERIGIEIMRGCPGRCLFCQASFCKRPIRLRSPAKIVEIAKKSYEATGFDTVSLLSLSTADYPHLEELVDKLGEYFRQRHVGLSLPSLRVDKQLKLIPKLLTSVRKSGLTIAVESANEQIRWIVNKPLADEDLFEAVESAYRAGWGKLKLYFMVGLPGETEEDVRRIVSMAYDLAKLRKKVDNKTGQINAAISWFVPKPHTPLGWMGQREKEYFHRARQIILNEKRRLRAGFLNFKFHNIERSVLESAIGRADRRMADVIEAAWRKGARFDLWNECFDYAIWQEAFAEAGGKVYGSAEQAAQRQYNPNEPTAWEHLGGPNKKYLLRHLNEALKKLHKRQKEIRD